MKDLLQNLDWNTVLTTIWTVILLPVLTYTSAEIKEYAKAKKINKYMEILQSNASDVVKDVYETIVKDIKGTDDWTDEKKDEVKEIAKQKILLSLSNTTYSLLSEANSDFEDYLNSLIEASLFDVKNTLKQEAR